MLSGPLVRSSYRAGRLYQQALDARKLTHRRELSLTAPLPAQLLQRRPAELRRRSMQETV